MTVRLVVFDVDGTLYSQRVLRALMVGELLVFLIRHPLRFRDVIIIREYRRVHETFHSNEFDNLDEALVAAVSARLSIGHQQIHEAVNEWLFRRPLKYLRYVYFPEVKATINHLKKNGVMVTFLSDHYPGGKLQALGFKVEGAYYSTRPDLNCLKPNPNLLSKILSDFGVLPCECVVIGDRDDRDGELARGAGAHFILFPNKKHRVDLLARIESFSLL